jgi:hypothetical protein
MSPADALQKSALALWVKQSPGVFPTLETLHILGFALLFGSLVVYHLRVLGAGGGSRLEDLARATLPWSLASLVVVVPTGFLMFIGAAADLIANRAFVWKIGLMLIAGANAGLYHMLYRNCADGRPWWGARVQAALSIVLWCAVISCGRWVAYV